MRYYITRRKKRQRKKENKNGTKTTMHTGSRPSREGTRMVFAGGTVSPMMCPSQGQQKDDKKARRETRQEEGRDKEPTQNVGRNKVVGFP